MSLATLWYAGCPVPGQRGGNRKQIWRTASEGQRLPSERTEGKLKVWTVPIGLLYVHRAEDLHIGKSSKIPRKPFLRRVLFGSVSIWSFMEQIPETTDAYQYGT